jgi:predicted membrane protein
MTTLPEPQARIAWLPLGLALLIMFALTLYPPLLQRADGHADHTAASFLFYAMSAGFVRGVGFVPRLRVLRWVFSTPACLLGLGLALAVLWR